VGYSSHTTPDAVISNVCDAEITQLLQIERL